MSTVLAALTATVFVAWGFIGDSDQHLWLAIVMMLFAILYELGDIKDKMP